MADSVAPNPGGAGAGAGAHANPPTDDDPIAIVQAPWTLTGDFYILSYWISAAGAANLPTGIAYSPLEAASQYADASVSRPVGGIAMIQIIRYHNSPVGPYDELAIVPGKFEWSRETPDGQKIKGQDLKISRIYVSQKHTCFNGRANWNIPKHLARFDWTDNADGSVTVKVYPYDTAGDATETTASATPFIQATMKSVPLVPSFPFSTAWSNYIGVGDKLVCPPLPEGKGSHGELPGTSLWCKSSPVIRGNRASLITLDMSQRNENGDLEAEYDNFWPGIGKWHVGIKMTGATMSIGAPDETW